MQIKKGFGAQLNMLDCKMSSSLSPVAPVNMLSECYEIWGNELAHPPPTKLETTDIMDLIEPSLCTTPRTGDEGGGEGGDGEHCGGAGLSIVEPGSTSPTAIIHHTGNGEVTATSNRHHHSQHHHPNPHHLSHSNSDGASPYSSNSSPSSSASSTSSSTSSSTPYLISLPSLGDPYGSNECHILEGFHSGLEPPFHKLSEASHPFQEGGYDAFISDLSHPPNNATLSGHHHHHPHQNPHHPQHNHHPQHHQQPHSHGNLGATPIHDSGNNGGGVLLLDMSHHHPHHLHSGQGGQCSPGCVCGGTGAGHYSLGGDPLSELCPPGLLTAATHHLHGGQEGHLHNPHLHHHPNHQQHPHLSHHHQQNPHQQEYSGTWDDLHCGEPSADYSILFRKGDSPSTSESISYTDNDSESKSSGGSLSGITEITHVSPPKRKVGRPPKKDKKMKRNEKKTGRLWEFIRDLLKNPKYCPSLVKWENHEEGHFRFVNSEKVAQLWGEIKKNPRMTYEKLSRAMRYYYKSHVFEPVLGRRLVYKFGYNATNWKPINPNFAASSHPKMYN